MKSRSLHQKNETDPPPPFWTTQRISRRLLHKVLPNYNLHPVEPKSRPAKMSRGQGWLVGWRRGSWRGSRQKCARGGPRTSSFETSLRICDLGFVSNDLIFLETANSFYKYPTFRLLAGLTAQQTTSGRDKPWKEKVGSTDWFGNCWELVYFWGGIIHSRVSSLSWRLRSSHTEQASMWITKMIFLNKKK